MNRLAERTAQWLVSHVPALTAAARAVQADVYPHQTTMGIGNDWADPALADYYAQSVPVFSAVDIRGNSLAKIPWVVKRRTEPTGLVAVDRNHPMQRILDRPNPWFSGAELRRATEINMCLYGRAFWTIEDPEEPGGLPEIWPVNPARMVVLPGQGTNGPYIRGYLYRGLNGDRLYLPEDVEFFRFYNPLQDRTGMSPLAPGRMSADMGKDALRYNRNSLRNGSMPDFILFGEEEMTDVEVDTFYRRWEERFRGPNQANRPAITSNIKDAKALGFSNRDMEFIASLTWSLRDVSRLYHVPTTMMADLESATLANMDKLEQIYWEDTIQPQGDLYAERLTTSTLPRLGYAGLEVEFDYSNIQALNEGAEARAKRENEQLDRGVLTINEVRATYKLPPVSWGSDPHFRQAGGFPDRPSQPNNRPPDA